MKKQLVLTTLILSTLLIGCGTNSNVSKNTETVTATETAHEHNYVETVTTEPTCEADGEATYTCDCGDTYTEAIPATGHSFTNYVSNNDATYTEDGTETAKCDNCDATDTRTAEGSKLAYTFTDMDATKYAKSTVNVRSMPTQDGDKVGSLSFNQEVKVTGQCNETGWYRIEYSGETVYVSDSYLVDNKVETAKKSSNSNGSSSSGNASASSGSNSSGNSSASNSSSGDSSSPSSSDSSSASDVAAPPLYTVLYDNWNIPYIYVTREDCGVQNDAYWNAVHAIEDARAAQNVYETDQFGNQRMTLCRRQKTGKHYVALCIQSYLNDLVDTDARGITLY